MKIVFGWPLIAAPSSALLAINAGGVAGLYSLTSKHGPLRKIWTNHDRSALTARPVTNSCGSPESFASAGGNEQAQNSPV
jgi:hypothetical protein